MLGYKKMDKEAKIAKGRRRLWMLIVILAFVVGILVGTSIGIKVGERQAFENLGIMLEGTTFNMNFNETYIMDRTEEITWNLTEYFLSRFPTPVYVNTTEEGLI